LTGGDPLEFADAAARVPLDSSLALPPTWYERDVEAVAVDLLGCLLVSERGDGTAAGIIVETEAYGGADDLASHAAFRRNGAVRAMYGPAGTLYVYVAYGTYPCANVVTGPQGEPSAVLIRALAPVTGVELMASRQGKRPGPRVAGGPGLLSRALAITPDDNERFLDRPPLWIQPGKPSGPVMRGPRVGITREAQRRWRFGIAEHPSLSRPFRSV
jgi:DNA-3-methyladenine glycosylase